MRCSGQPQTLRFSPIGAQDFRTRRIWCHMALLCLQPGLNACTRPHGLAEPGPHRDTAQLHSTQLLPFSSSSSQSHKGQNHDHFHTQRGRELLDNRRLPSGASPGLSPTNEPHTGGAPRLPQHRPQQSGARHPVPALHSPALSSTKPTRQQGGLQPYKPAAL